MSGLLNIKAVGEVVDRILGKVDQLATSDQERLELRNELESMRIEFARQILDAELELTRKRSEIGRAHV